ncbi:murein transglycosylase [Picosynechococcus sp. PCC 7003]|uniref:murein transglycosylase A n=1 Tax=Picosynechococcus sp. PCC 7003 TaxID=374981 RepID=UPI0008109AFB|nr:MltA domain-containing protein [Picosynechococcus sp. PCC 7003]ANV85156.1 murein transglycosylase [Picosynechococcus sp. PCC 7003]
MKIFWSGLTIATLGALASLVSQPGLTQVLQPTTNPGAIALPDYGLWQNPERQKLLNAIDHSLRYIDTNTAQEDYTKVQVPGFSREKVRRSLVRFRQLVQQYPDPRQLHQAIQQEFVFYRSVGKDGMGQVDFTAYFEPAYVASPVKTSEFQYPLYRQPPGFENWSQPHPSRIALEGRDGIPPSNSPLRGHELVWLKSRLEAYLIQVQGSARLQLTDGRTMTIGFDGSTDYEYVSLGKELINEGIFQPEELSLPKLIDYFEANPAELSTYIPRNNRFIFFQETFGSPPIGSIGVPVLAERSIATDKSIFPPGAIAFIATQLPYQRANGDWLKLPVSRYVLDQDTGSAIKGAGRVDIFLGTGPNTQTRAGLVNDPGNLYYLLLKD